MVRWFLARLISRGTEVSTGARAEGEDAIEELRPKLRGEFEGDKGFRREVGETTVTAPTKGRAGVDCEPCFENSRAGSVEIFRMHPRSEIESGIRVRFL